MKAIVCREYGPPESLVLADDVDDPVPDDSGVDHTGDTFEE